MQGTAGKPHVRIAGRLSVVLSIEVVTAGTFRSAAD